RGLHASINLSRLYREPARSELGPQELAATFAAHDERLHARLELELGMREQRLAREPCFRNIVNGDIDPLESRRGRLADGRNLHLRVWREKPPAMLDGIRAREDDEIAGLGRCCGLRLDVDRRKADRLAAHPLDQHA